MKPSISHLQGGIHKENLSPVDRCNFIVCSMFTQGDANYIRYANRLGISCEKYLLPYAIYTVPSIHTSVSLLGAEHSDFTKANFILWNMERFPERNILYVDVDVFFIDFPKTLIDVSKADCDFAVYNWLNDEHNEAYLPVVHEQDGKALFSEFYVYSHHIDYFCREQLICSGGVQFYRNAVPAKRLLEFWQNMVTRHPHSADDECLDYTYNNLDKGTTTLRSEWLDKSYLRLPWWPHVKPVVLHPGIPIAGSNRKPLSEEHGQKRFYPGRCTKKEVPLYFPQDCVIDTTRKLLLRIANSRVVDVKTIRQDFWIYNEHD